MKHLLIATTVVFWCVSCSAQEANTTDKPQALPGEKQAAKADSADLEVRVETGEGLVKYYRRGQLVLSRAVSHPDLYYVRGPGGLYASVILNQPTSPRIGIFDHFTRINMEVERIDDDTRKLHVMGFESDFIEAYVLTPKSIAPVSADEFSRLLAQWQAAREWSESFLESLKELNESPGDDQPTDD